MRRSREARCADNRAGSRLTDLDGTDLLSEENLSDINDIAAVLKLWFRELPEPLLTWELYHQFIDAASECRPTGCLRARG